MKRVERIEKIQSLALLRVLQINLSILGLEKKRTVKVRLLNMLSTLTFRLQCSNLRELSTRLNIDFCVKIRTLTTLKASSCYPSRLSSASVS